MRRVYNDVITDETQAKKFTATNGKTFDTEAQRDNYQKGFDSARNGSAKTKINSNPTKTVTKTVTKKDSKAIDKGYFSTTFLAPDGTEGSSNRNDASASEMEALRDVYNQARLNYHS